MIWNPKTRPGRPEHSHRGKHPSQRSKEQWEVNYQTQTQRKRINTRLSRQGSIPLSEVRCLSSVMAAGIGTRSEQHRREDRSQEVLTNQGPSQRCRRSQYRRGESNQLAVLAGESTKLWRNKSTKLITKLSIINKAIKVWNFETNKKQIDLETNLMLRAERKNPSRNRHPEQALISKTSQKK